MRLASSASGSTRAPDLLSTADWDWLVRSLALSPREEDLLRGIFLGQHVSAFACILAAAAHTVGTYRESIYRKLGVRACTQLFALTLAEFIRPPIVNIAQRTTLSRLGCAPGLEYSG